MVFVPLILIEDFLKFFVEYVLLDHVERIPPEKTEIFQVDAFILIDLGVIFFFLSDRYLVLKLSVTLHR